MNTPPSTVQNQDNGNKKRGGGGVPFDGNVVLNEATVAVSYNRHPYGKIPLTIK